VQDSSSSSSDDEDGTEEEHGDGEEVEPPKRNVAIGHGALGSVDVPGGTIRMYWDADVGQYYAVAVCDSHTDCEKRRTFGASKRGKRAQGRPMGFLTAWLKRGMELSINTSFKHKWRCSLTREKRREARVVCGECVGAAALLREERPPWSDEEEEPQGEP